MTKEFLYKSLNLCSSGHSTHRRLRVADILNDDGSSDGGYIGESSMDCIGETKLQRNASAAIRCSSPIRFVARWLVSLRKDKERKVVEEKQKPRNGLNQSESLPLYTSCSLNGQNGREESGQHSLRRNDTAFKLGVGCGFLYLIAASKNELTKVVELRKEMEMLLQNAKDELERKDELLNQGKQDDTLVCSITDIQEVSSSDSHPLIQSQSPYVQPQSEGNAFRTHFLDYNLSARDEYVEGMHELEEQLQVELEQLQPHLDGETTFEDTQEERIKVEINDSRSRSHSTTFDEIIDPQETSTEMCFGVPPVELERRLHELLEARQQEQIADLESALECARHKLFEKEIEIAWWKDTALLISEHVPETSRFTFQLDPDTVSKLK